MPTPLFPRTETLLDGKACPLAQFDSLYSTVTQSPGGLDGYFVHAHPGELRLLFVVDGYPYGTGRFSETGRTFEDIHDFFAAYSRWPDSPLSFLAADKALLVALMICFQHRAARVVLEPSDLDELLAQLADRGATAVLSLQAGDAWAISLCSKGQPVRNVFPPDNGVPPSGSAREQLRAYVAAVSPVVELFEQTRVTPAPDLSLITRETQGQFSLAFLNGAAAAAPEPRPFEPEAARAVEPVEPAAMTPPPEPEPAAAQAEALEVPQLVSEEPGVGTQAAELQLYIGDKQIGAYPLAGGEATIGRSPGNTVVIENAGVSKRHAVVRYEGEQPILEDLTSTNGTFVNGQRISRYELRDGDEITIVKHRLVFRAGARGEGAGEKPAPLTDAQHTMAIDTTNLQRPTGRGESPQSVLRPRLILPDLKKLPLDDQRDVTLGTGSDCTVSLSGMFVGRLHAKVVPQKDGQFKLVHVSGLAGTRVNGEKVSEHLLHHGDEIEIGKQRILFRLER